MIKREDVKQQIDKAEKELNEVFYDLIYEHGDNEGQYELNDLDSGFHTLLKYARKWQRQETDKERKMKVEIEEVLEIVKEKQSRKAESLRRHSATAKSLERKEDPESKRKRDLEIQAICEALSSFLTLCEVYAAISAMELRKKEQEEA